MKNFSYIKPNLLAYGGNAGNKKGFTNEKGENWFLKFPQNTKYFEKVNISYTTSPISEYLGSKIYELLGYDVHKTELGIYNDKIVVACKDFISDNKRLCDIASITNNYLDENEDVRQNLKSSNEEKYFVDLEELMYVFKLHKIPNLKERFWDMFVVDAFINNSDRHNGNWGVLVDLKNNEVKLAPIFDNGNSFFAKHDDSKLEKILQNEISFQSNVLRGKTPFKYLEHSVDAIKVIKNLTIGKEKNKFTDEISENIKEAIKRVVPRINLREINSLIDEIPTEYNGIKIMSDTMKIFYKKFLEQKYEKILLPSLNKVLDLEKDFNEKEKPKRQTRSRVKSKENER